MIQFPVHFPLRLSKRLVAGSVMALLTIASPAWAQDDPNQQGSSTNAGIGGTGSGTGADDDTTRAMPTNGAGSSAQQSNSGTPRLQNPSRRRGQQQQQQQDEFTPAVPPKYEPSEFERYVQGQAPTQTTSSSPLKIRRFGANLISDPAFSAVDQDPLPSVPGDYIIKPGDEIALTIWGSVDANLELPVDRSGMIAVPRVGAIRVAGLPYAELADTISRRTAQVFRNFQLTATVGQVRAMRVYVTGFAQRPGSTTVSGLASVLNALMRAGGPSAAGSFRDIRLIRAGKQIAAFDLYDLLLRGSRESDHLVQPDDVIFVGPVGPQVALVGSVNQQAIFELKAGENLSDLLRMGGGFTAVADRSRLTIERLEDRGKGHVADLELPAHANDALPTGSVVRAYSVVAAEQPSIAQNKRVHIDGEVVRPGDYIMPPNSTLTDVVQMAGGLTPLAYPFGTEFTRESVRVAQQANFDRALRDLETDMVKNQSTQRSTSAEETAAQSAAAASNQRLIDRLRQARPTGRVVMPVGPSDTSLPDFPVESGDVIHVPPRGTSVGVFGSVFSTGSFVFVNNHTAGDYLELAGGPTRGADKSSMFMIRANGSVVSAMQTRSFWSAGNGFRDTIVQPGDTIFVPEELNKSTFIQDAKDWTQILYQFGLGVAGIKSLGL